MEEFQMHFCSTCYKISAIDPTNRFSHSSLPLGVPFTRSWYKIQKTHENISQYLWTTLGSNIYLQWFKALRFSRQIFRGNASENLRKLQFWNVWKLIKISQHFRTQNYRLLYGITCVTVLMTLSAKWLLIWPIIHWMMKRIGINYNRIRIPHISYVHNKKKNIFFGFYFEF